MKKNTFDKAKTELEWLFNCSESECGIQSNFAPIFEACLYATPKSSYKIAVDFHILNDTLKKTHSQQNIRFSVNKERAIYNRYQKLDQKSKLIIEAFFESRKYNHELIKLFGEGIGVIPFTSIGLSFSKILLRESNKTFIQEFKNNKWKIKKEVDQLINQAINNFSEIV